MLEFLQSLAWIGLVIIVSMVFAPMVIYQCVKMGVLGYKTAVHNFSMKIKKDKNEQSKETATEADINSET